MEQFVGLDVSQKLTHICVVDREGKAIWRGSSSTTPEDIAAAVRAHAPGAVRIGFETGALSTWLWHGLKKIGLPIVCLDARHAKAVLSMQVNKSDRNDAFGLAQIVRTGWYREVGATSTVAKETSMRHPHSGHRQPDLFSPQDPPVPIAAFDRAKLLPLVSALL